MIGSQKSILVVEDDEDLCQAIEDALLAAGFKTIGVSSTREALSKLKNQIFSCVLVDINLGDERGDELIKYIRARVDVLSKNSPVLLISGHLESNVLRDLAGKVQGALVKPFDMSSLINQVKKISI